ncbi:MAG: DUF6879 family protein [Pseudonocardiaceae bacterium]
MLPPGAPEFSAWFRQFQRSCFRLETLQRYGASGEDDSIKAFLSGATPQPHPGKQEWMALVRAAVRDQRTMQRVHVVTEPLTDYVCFEVAWSYAHSVAAGEDVRIIPLTEGQQWPPDLPPAGNDFWLFDDTELFPMRYDTEATWIGIDHTTDPDAVLQACRWRDAALHLAQPWATFVNERPELARRVPTGQ